MNASSPLVFDPALITRRDMLGKLGAGTLLALGVWPGAVRAGAAQPGGEFTFVVVNDTHYRDEECGRWLGVVAGMIRAERPDFCLHLGDLVDVGSREHHAAVRAVLDDLGVPAYVVIGNHDYTTQTDRTAFEAVYPGRINYRFEHRGWQFVGVDSTDGLRYQNTPIPAATLAWVDAVRPELDRDRPLVLFTHFPLADGVKYQPVNAGALLERFRDHNLQAVFDGHFHGFTEKRWQAATLTTNRCCSLKVHNHDGTREKGFFVCTTRGGRVTRRFVEVPLPPAAATKG